MNTALMPGVTGGAIGDGVLGTTATGSGGGEGRYGGPWGTSTPESAGRFLTDLMAS